MSRGSLHTRIMTSAGEFKASFLKDEVQRTTLQAQKAFSAKQAEVEASMSALNRLPVTAVVVFDAYHLQI